MPEAFTYFDMERRVRSAIYEPQDFRLEIHPEFGQKRARARDERTQRGKAKMRLLKDRPDLFEPYPEATFPGHMRLPTDFFTKIHRLSGEDVGSHGKSIFVHFGHGWYVECQLRLHGHVVVMSRQELDAIKASWTTQEPRHEFQLALVNQRASGMCVVACDKNCLSIFRFGRTAIPFALTRDALRASFPKQSLGYCPIKEQPEFLQQVRSWTPPASTQCSIYESLCSQTVIFNGIGTSHANEVLHLALLHPLAGTREVMGNVDLRDRLCAGLAKFLAFVEDPAYRQSIPAGRTGATAFHEPLGITTYINQNFLKVYRHTKTRTKIPVGQYEELKRLGYLDPREVDTVQKQRPVKQSREVQVYCIELRSSAGPLAKRRYVYTCICAAAAPASVSMGRARYLTLDEASGKAVDAATGMQEIGIASFMGNRRYRLAENGLLRRRRPQHTGQVGRPRQSKLSAAEILDEGVDSGGHILTGGQFLTQLDADTEALQAGGWIATAEDEDGAGDQEREIGGRIRAEPAAIIDDDDGGDELMTAEELFDRTMLH